MGKPSLTRSCAVYGRPVHDSCDTGRDFAPTKASWPSFWESHYLAWSSACWNVEFTHRSRDRKVFVSEQDTAPATTPGELARSSTLSQKNALSPAPAHFQNAPSPALVDTATNVVEVLDFTTSIVLPSVLKISDFGKIEYRADVSTLTNRLRTYAAPIRTMLKKCATGFVRASE